MKKRRNQDTVPEDYPQLPGEEKLPAGDEFSQKVRTETETPSRKRPVLAAAAAFLLLCMVFLNHGAGEAAQNVPAEPQAAEATAVPVEETAATPTPEPPAVEQQPETVVVFVACSDEMQARLSFINPEAIVSVHAELWDTQADRMEQEWDVPGEDILTGSYLLPEMLSHYEIYMKYHEDFDHMDEFPVPELRVCTTYLKDGEETAETVSYGIEDQLGWGARVRDGSLVFRSYESETPFEIVVVNGELDESYEVPENTFAVAICIDGKYVDAADCEISTEELTWYTEDGSELTWYYAVLTVPCAEGSVAEVTAAQQLNGYDGTWVSTKTCG